MDPDISLVIGLVIGGLSVPAVVSALVDGRAPRGAAVAMAVAGCLTVFAISTKPGGYRIDQIPEVFGQVLGSLV